MNTRAAAGVVCGPVVASLRSGQGNVQRIAIYQMKKANDDDILDVTGLIQKQTSKLNMWHAHPWPIYSSF
jgi:hypothetical protein